MPRLVLQIVVLIFLAAAPLARAQPFFGGGVSAFSPEISVINSGVLNDVQATVSPDRKYVTLTMRPANSELLNLFTFTFQQQGQLTSQQQAQVSGFVGGVQFNGAATGEFGAVNPPVVLGPGKGTALIRQRGMTRIIVK